MIAGQTARLDIFSSNFDLKKNSQATPGTSARIYKDVISICLLLCPIITQEPLELF